MTTRLVGPLFLSLLLVPAVSAAIILTGEEVAVPFSEIPQVGSLEFFLESTETDPPDLVAFQLRVELPPASSITLINIDDPTEHPYVFGGFSSVLGLLSNDGTLADAGDFLTQDAVTLASTAGLVKLGFQVAGNTPPGIYPLLISPDPNDTFLVDDSLADLAFTIHNGSITVGLPIPEPGMFSLVLTGMISGWLIRGRRR